MQTYTEEEIKVLDVNVKELQLLLESLGAIKVYDHERIFTTFDTKDSKYTSSNKVIRLTEEKKLKLSISYINESGFKEIIKLFTSRKEETIDFLDKLGIYPIAEVKSHRISYERDNIDFDIDQFPQIPAFLEIETKDLESKIEKILHDLHLTKKHIVKLGTEEIFTKYGKSYYDIFKI